MAWRFHFQDIIAYRTNVVEMLEIFIFFAGSNQTGDVRFLSHPYKSLSLEDLFRHTRNETQDLYVREDISRDGCFAYIQLGQKICFFVKDDAFEGLEPSRLDEIG